MKSKRAKSLSDFVSYRGEYSSGRLISLIGSGVVLSLLIKNPENIGIQQLAMAVIGYSFAATTVSKFAKQDNQYNEGSNYFEENRPDAPTTQGRDPQDL